MTVSKLTKTLLPGLGLLFVLVVPLLLIFHSFSVPLLSLFSRAALGTPGCSSNDPQVKLISQTMPGAVNLGQQFQVTEVIQNCSSETWTKGVYKLGSQAPQDNLKWSAGRIDFPGDVKPNDLTTVAFLATAPAAPGAYVAQWGVLSQTAWYKPYLPPALVIVGTPRDCDGVAALKNSGQDATDALQSCLDSTPAGGMVELAAGTYLVSKPIRITKPLTVLTKESKSFQARCLENATLPCAMIKATADFPKNSPVAGLENNTVLVISAPNVTLKNLIINGDRYGRTKLATLCNAADDERSMNINATTQNSNFFYSASIRAGCGSAMRVVGDQNTFGYNYIAENGFHLLKQQWSDGMSLQGKSLVVTNNVFRDNTDVDLILWGAAKSDIYFNQVIHDNANYFSYAGIMLNTFGNSPDREALADFTDASLSYNSVKCNGYCGYGLQIGERPWVPTTVNNIGGTVAYNQVTGALQGINLDGTGRPASPTKVYGNVSSGNQSVTLTINGRKVTTGNLNEASGNSIAYDKGQSPDTRQKISDGIPTLLSCNSFPALCKDESPKSTTYMGNVYCQGKDGQQYPMSNVSIRIYGSANKDTITVTTDGSGNFSTSKTEPYQSYQIAATLPPAQKISDPNGNQYKDLVYSGGYCTSWLSGCVNSSCGAGGSYEGCILEPGKTNGPFVFAYTNCTTTN